MWSSPSDAPHRKAAHGTTWANVALRRQPYCADGAQWANARAPIAWTFMFRIRRESPDPRAKRKRPRLLAAFWFVASSATIYQIFTRWSGFRYSFASGL